MSEWTKLSSSFNYMTKWPHFMQISEVHIIPSMLLVTGKYTYAPPSFGGGSNFLSIFVFGHYSGETRPGTRDQEGDTHRHKTAVSLDMLDEAGGADVWMDWTQSSAGASQGGGLSCR